MNRRTVRLHHRLAVRLAVVGGAHLPDLAFDPEQRTGEGQRAAPLAGASLRGQPPDPLLGVVEDLGDGRVGLVGADRTHALVLVVDPGRRSQRLLQPVSAVEGGRPPEPVDVQNLRRDVDVGLLRDLLTDEGHREQRCQVIGSDWLVRRRVQDRWWRGRQIWDEVVPLAGQLGFIEQDLGRLGHSRSIALRESRYAKINSPSFRDSSMTESAPHWLFGRFAAALVTDVRPRWPVLTL